MENHILKGKTAFVLQRLEQGIWNFVSQQSVDTGSIRSGLPVSIKNEPELVFIRDVFERFYSVLQDEDQRSQAKNLIQLAHQTELWAIRNACSHVGRPFLPCYWYRVASIATHPLLLSLGITDPLFAVEAAESNSFEPVDSEWADAYLADIPNNLPKTADFDVTGLIGRRKERIQVEELLRNQRVPNISVVAPGGTGKTAMILEILRKLVADPHADESFSGIVFCSFKQEELTQAGRQSLGVEAVDQVYFSQAVLASINDVLDTKHESLESAIDDSSSQRLLLCLDNVEELILNDAELLRNFEDSLPVTWKLVSTSRIPVDGSRVVSVGPMLRKEALHLSRQYSLERQASLEQEQLQSITESCACNPLAIKLTIDTVVAGGTVADSISVSNQQIAEFSFQNLIEALDRTDIMILEMIHAGSAPTKAELCETLSLSEEEVAVSLRRLKATSLLENHIDNDVEGSNYWHLNESLKDYLSTNTRNLQIRAEISSLMKKRRQLTTELNAVNQLSNLPDWHQDYVPTQLSPRLRELLSSFKFEGVTKHRVRTSSALAERISETFKEFRENETLFSAEADFWVSYAKLAALLNLPEAPQYFENAIALDPSSMKARLGLIKYLDAEGHIDECIKQSVDAMNIMKGLSPSEPGRLRANISIVVCNAAIKGKNFQFVYDHTEKWKDLSGKERAMLGTFRAKALKREAEFYSSDPEQALPILIRASRILRQVIEYEEMSKPQAKEFFQIAREFGRLSGSPATSLFVEQISELLEFCSEFFDEAKTELGAHHKKPINYPDLLRNLSKFETGKPNPFGSVNWSLAQAPAITTGIDIEEAEQNYRLLRIQYIPEPDRSGYRKPFLFLEDESQNRYFLHKSSLPIGEIESWSSLQVGYNIAAEKIEDSSTGRYPIVTSALFVRT